VVFGRVTESLRQRIAADRTFATEAAGFRRAVVDRTIAVDEGDRRTAVAHPRAARHLEVFAERLELGLAAGFRQRRSLGFVVVALLVDQLLVDRFLRDVRRAVDEGHDFLTRLLAIGRDARGRRFKDGFEKAHARLAVRGGEVLLGELVRRVLVLVTLRE